MNKNQEAVSSNLYRKLTNVTAVPGVSGYKKATTTNNTNNNNNNSNSINKPIVLQSSPAPIQNIPPPTPVPSLSPTPVPSPSPSLSTSTTSTVLSNPLYEKQNNLYEDVYVESDPGCPPCPPLESLSFTPGNKCWRKISHAGRHPGSVYWKWYEGDRTIIKFENPEYNTTYEKKYKSARFGFNDHVSSQTASLKVSNSTVENMALSSSEGELSWGSSPTPLMSRNGGDMVRAVDELRSEIALLRQEQKELRSTLKEYGANVSKILENMNMIMGGNQIVTSTFNELKYEVKSLPDKLLKINTPSTPITTNQITPPATIVSKLPDPPKKSSLKIKKDKNPMEDKKAMKRKLSFSAEMKKKKSSQCEKTIDMESEEDLEDKEAVDNLIELSATPRPKKEDDDDDYAFCNSPLSLEGLTQKE